MACTAFEVNGTALDIAPTETAVELSEEPPIDELRVETQPEPSVYYGAGGDQGLRAVD